MADELNANTESQTGGAGNPMQSGGIEQGAQQKSNLPEESGKTGKTATDKTYTQQDILSLKKFRFRQKGREWSLKISVMK